MIAEMSKVEADDLLEKIGEYRAQIAAAEMERDNYIQHYQKKILSANNICDLQCKEARQEIAVLEEQLHRFAVENLPEGKKSIRLPSGKLSFRKQAPKFYFADAVEVSGSDSRLIDFAKRNAPEYVKVKTVESADWAELKKNLVFNGQDVFLSDGQQLEGVHVQFFNDKFTVELS